MRGINNTLIGCFYNINLAKVIENCHNHDIFACNQDFLNSACKKTPIAALGLTLSYQALLKMLSFLADTK